MLASYWLIPIYLDRICLVCSTAYEKRETLGSCMDFPCSDPFAMIKNDSRNFATRGLRISSYNFRRPTVSPPCTSSGSRAELREWTHFDRRWGAREPERNPNGKTGWQAPPEEWYDWDSSWSGRPYPSIAILWSHPGRPVRRVVLW